MIIRNGTGYDVTRDELENKLVRLRDELEDLEETFSFNLCNTSAHINSGVVAEHEDEMNDLKAEIARMEGLLAEYEPGGLI